MKKGELKQLILGLIAGIIAFLFTLGVGMPLPLIALIPVGVYFGVYMISKPEIKIGDIKLNEANGEELKELMRDAYEDLEILKDGSQKIQHPEIRRLSLELYDSGVSIFKHLQSNPDKISLARRFINYYLDTAGGLTKKYKNLQNSKVRGESVIKAENQTIKGLTMLTEAFDQQYERLMQGDIMDITTEVKVLEQTYKSEV